MAHPVEPAQPENLFRKCYPCDCNPSRVPAPIVQFSYEDSKTASSRAPKAKTPSYFLRLCLSGLYCVVSCSVVPSGSIFIIRWLNQRFLHQPWTILPLWAFVRYMDTRHPHDYSLRFLSWTLRHRYWYREQARVLFRADHSLTWFHSNNELSHRLQSSTQAASWDAFSPTSSPTSTGLMTYSFPVFSSHPRWYLPCLESQTFLSSSRSAFCTDSGLARVRSRIYTLPVVFLT